MGGGGLIKNFYLQAWDLIERGLLRAFTVLESVY